MRHQRLTTRFSRDYNQRKALIRGLVNSLVEHGRICTTITKAKELRRYAEKAITIGKKNSLHARRVLLAKYPNKNTVNSIMTEWAPLFDKRNGGYTRILRLGARPGDAAEMVYIEFVGYEDVRNKSEAAEGSKKKGKTAKASETTVETTAKEAGAAKKTTKKAASAKKTTKKATSKS